MAKQKHDKGKQKEFKNWMNKIRPKGRSARTYSRGGGWDGTNTNPHRYGRP